MGGTSLTATRRHFFEQTILAHRYAVLLGREKPRELDKLREASSRQLSLWEREMGWSRTDLCPCNSAEAPAEAHEVQLRRRQMGRHLLGTRRIPRPAAICVESPSGSDGGKCFGRKG